MSTRATSLLVLFTLCGLVSCKDEFVKKSDQNIGQKLIDTIKSEYRMRELYYGNNNDGGLMFPKGDMKKEDEWMQTIDQLSPEDIKRLGHEVSTQLPFDKWLAEKGKLAMQIKDIQLTRLPGNLVETPLGNISEICYNDTMLWLEANENGIEWALRMASSWGEMAYLVERWSYVGKDKSLGIWDLCLDNPDGADGYAYPFETEYCLMDVFSGLKIGTCWPISCSSSDLTTIAWTYLGWLAIIYVPYYECELRHPEPWFGGAIATVTVIAFFATIVVAATIYHLTAHRYVKEKLLKKPDHVVKPTNGTRPEDHVYSNKAVEDGEEASTSFNNYGALQSETVKGANTKIEENAVEVEDKSRKQLGLIDRLILSSSAIHNTEKYLDCTVTSATTLCLNGLRVMSMFWIMLGHTHQFILFTRLDNNFEVLEQSEKLTFRAVTESPFGVDTFFFLSGLLLSYLTLKQLAKNKGKINWGLFYFHRWWRITPLYMVTIAVWSNLLWKWGQGPGKRNLAIYLHDTCKQFWWTHILYINNLYPFPGSVSDSCMGWAWYLANDMQFFAISPFILYLLYRSWKAGVLTVIIMCLVSFGSTIYLCVYWGLGFANTGFYNDRTANDERSGEDYIYGKPWHRIPAYLIGVLFGYMLYRLKGRQMNIGRWKNFLGWFMAVSTAMAIVYGTGATSPDTPQWAAVLYNTLARPLFTVCVAWVAFSCIMGYGGLVNSFLSWRVWIPLGRLTFGAYLVHPILIYWMLFTKKVDFHWTYVEISYLYVGNVVFAYAVAFLFVLLVEGPTGNLEEVLLGRWRRGNKKTNK